MGKKDTFNLTSVDVPTSVKKPQSEKVVKIKRDDKPSVDIQKLRELHAARQERAAEVRARTLANIKAKEKEAEENRNKTLARIDAKTRRIEEKNAITETLSEYAKNVKHFQKTANGTRRTYVDTVIHQYEQNPGPVYDPDRLRDRLDAPGVKINDGNPKGEIEWCEYRAKNLPGPGQYSDPKYKLPKGGRLPPSGEDLAKPKSYIEWEEYRASRIPGPADYAVHGKRNIGGDLLGGAFPKFSPMGLVEAAVFSKRAVPGPGQYESDAGADAGPSATISKTSGKSDVEWSMYRASQLPGPGDYSTKNTGIGGVLVNSGHGRSAPAIHMCREKRRTTTDKAIQLAKSTPGPGTYGNLNTPAREGELRQLRKAALQQIQEQEGPPRARSSTM